MRIWLNDYELNNPAKRVYIDPDIEGFDLPAIRTSRGNRAGQHGSYIGAQFYDSRRITIKGRIFSNNIAEALEKRRQLQLSLPLYPEIITLRLLDDDGYVYLLYCQLMDFKMPIGRFLGKSIFKIELEAPDSIIYDDTAGAELSALLYKAIAGGVLFSSTSPMFGSSTYFTSGKPNTIVNNASLIAAKPVITIPGKTTNPVITNRTTGQVFRMSNYATGPDSVTVIDMQNHTVTLNGGGVFAYVPLTSQWWDLVPGTNEISFDSGAGSDVDSAVMVWRPGLRGK